MARKIDTVFVLALITLFAATSFILVLIGAKQYRFVTDVMDENYKSRTTSSYLMEKIRQNDTSLNQRISIETFDGYEALTISQTINNTLYHTYIYEAEGELKELFIQDAISASADFGTTILEIGHLEMNEISDGLFQFICTSTDGSTDSVTISTRSYIH